MQRGLRGPRQVHDRRGRRCGGSRRASRRSGTPRSPWSRSPTPASRRDHEALERGGALAARRGDPRSGATGRCAGRDSSPAAGRSSSRTTTTRTSTTPPRWSWPCGARVDSRGLDEAADRGRRAGRSGWSRATAAGGRSTPTTPSELLPQAAVLRLRRGDRPAERRRHRARGRDAGGEQAMAAAAGCAARHRVAAARAGGGRLLVRPLGRQPRLRHRRGRARRSSRPGSRRSTHVDPARRPLARAACRTPTAAGARTCARTDDPGLARPRRIDRVADGVGAARAPRRRRARGTRSSAALRWLVETQRPDGELGRAVVHRHRLPGRLLHQLPPVPARVPGDGARPRSRDEARCVLAPLRIEALRRARLGLSSA